MRRGGHFQLCEQAICFTSCVTLVKLHTLSVYNHCRLPSKLCGEGGLKGWMLGTPLTAAFPQRMMRNNHNRVTGIEKKANRQLPHYISGAGDRVQCGTGHLALAGGESWGETGQPELLSRDL